MCLCFNFFHVQIAHAYALIIIIINRYNIYTHYKEEKDLVKKKKNTLPNNCNKFLLIIYIR